MAEKLIQHNNETYVITAQDGITKATFLPSRGAFGSSLQFPINGKPQEMLFQHDFFWDKEWHSFPGGLPFLFPVCARIGRDGQQGMYLYDGKQYHLKIHGFGWLESWAIEGDSASTLTMRLVANENTLSVYPFECEVRLRYEVKPGELHCYLTIVNHDKKAMPFYAGFHPYLLTPMPGQGKEQVMLDYAPYRRLKYNEAMTDIIGEQPLFELPTAVTNPEILEQLTMLHPDNNEIKLHFPAGYSLHLQASGIENPALFSYVQLYTMHDKPFFCAEPWMGFPNALNTVQGVQWLQSGESCDAHFKLWITENTLQ